MKKKLEDLFRSLLGVFSFFEYPTHAVQLNLEELGPLITLNSSRSYIKIHLYNNLLQFEYFLYTEDEKMSGGD